MEGKVGFGSLFSNPFALLPAVNPRLPAGAALLLALLAADTAAQNSRLVRPKGEQTTVEVMRGGSVRIPLIGHERNLNRLEYRTIGTPRYGRLSRVEQPGPSERQGTGYVTYTHGNDEESTTDTFAFEVRAPLTKMTGRGRVIIRILDAPARLEITPSTLDFGTMATGDTPVRRTVELANTGGGVIRGFLEVPEPFVLDDDGMFVLRRGEKTRIPVTFAPDRAGPYSFPVQPVPGDPAVLTLQGEALSPFSVEVGEARFVRQDNDGSRTATVAVRNASQQIQTISVVLPVDSQVIPPDDVDVAPGATERITLRIPPAHKTAVAPFDVRFDGAGHAQVHRFSVTPVPAELAVVRAPDFGEVRRGTTALADLVLRNDGGTPAEARLQEHASISPANGATALTVAPGEELTVPLKLRLKPDQDLPENILIAFRGGDIPAEIKASLVEVPRPSASPSPSPKVPPRLQWVLNEDIKYIPAPAGPALQWVEKPGGGGVELQYQPDSGGPWQRYEMPAPPTGLMEWFRGLRDRIGKFLTTEIARPDVEDMAGMTTPVETRKIAEASMANGRWRLFAPPDRDVTVAFRIEGDRLVPAEDTAATATEERPPAAPSSPTGAPRVRALGPETPLASAGIKADRRSALLQVAFAPGLRVQGFRLERGAMVAQIDPQTLIPQAPEFQKIDPPEADVEVLGLGEGEADGTKFTVGLARISGLQPGTRTYWRVVPAGPQGDLPPTTVLLVDTEALPPFPWNTALLVALFALLAGVLYLRWKINRVPR